MDRDAAAVGAEQVDVVVVGLGPGGEFAANKLALAGLNVVAVDKHLVGGECPFYGCVPSKIMIRAANALQESRRVNDLAGESSPVPSWEPVARRIREDGTHDWSDEVSVARLERAGAVVLHGAARLTGPRTVEVAGRRFHAARGVLVATGTAPDAPPVAGLADTPYWTNREVVKVTELPSSLAVLGAGPIGCELAQAFARFGVAVTLLEADDRILSAEEPEAAEVLSGVLAREGVRVMPGAAIERVDHADGRFSLTLAGESVGVEKLLVAAGRRSNLAGIGLEAVGVDPSGPTLAVDDRMRVRDATGAVVDGLYAVGDIVGHGAFTHTAKYQAAIVVRCLLGEDGPAADFRAVPRVTYTDPEVGGVGVTEIEALEQGRPVRVGLARLADSARGHLHGPGGEGFVKLVAEGEVLIGATSVGPTGGEVLAMLTAAVHAAVPLETLRSMIYAYPTFHGAVRNALSDLE